eukprot:3439729-Prymnesium_polylepis.1
MSRRESYTDTGTAPPQREQPYPQAKRRPSARRRPGSGLAHQTQIHHTGRKDLMQDTIARSVRLGRHTHTAGSTKPGRCLRSPMG